MNKIFYPKLAAMNIWKNRRIYVPYILTCIFNIAMFYMMYYMYFTEDLKTIPGWDTLKIIMILGVIIIGIFSLIFLCYSNSFLTKRRRKEFGLYNVLGMEKRHIRRTLCWETLYVMILGYGGGFLLGIIGSKLLFLLLLKIMKVPAQFGFEISQKSMVGTFFWFLGIFFFTLILNMWQIHLANPMELLRGGNTGEKEPKAKWLLVLLGVLTMGAGYYIAISVENPLEALLLFFVAVILVMIGTYCLFTAGSIAVLKMLRWNKKFYYQTRHFTSISGMLYRMKQNAVGLANICILSTGVLLMISGTISMYGGMEDMAQKRYPHEVEYTLTGEETETVKAPLQSYMETTVGAAGQTVSYLDGYYYLDFSTNRKEDGKLELIDYETEAVGGGAVDLVTVSVMTLEDYNRIMGEQKVLEKPEEILLYAAKSQMHVEELQVQDMTFQVKEVLESHQERGVLTAYVGEVYYLIVRDRAVLDAICQMQEAYYETYASEIQYALQMDFTGSDEEKKAVDEQLKAGMDDLLSGAAPEGGIGVMSDYKQLDYKYMFSLYGGLFFLGLFLGILFLMGTTLIIYYKQVSEGYDDRERFVIMQKVGMSKKEVRQSIKSQVLTVFFLPLVMAWIHVGVAFPMMTRVLSALSLFNVKLFAVCTILTAAVFALVYAAIYGITARVYYKIVD